MTTVQYNSILDHSIEYMGLQPLKPVTNSEEIYSEFNVNDQTKSLTSLRPLEFDCKSTIVTKTSIINTQPLMENTYTGMYFM